jgi:S-(hydroxymethyl)glutathione dehydrogenase/alcohol dehydrogenase
VQFDGACKAQLANGGALRHLMFLGTFGDYCIVQDQQAIAVPNEIPFDRACLIGCGVMTGVGAALNIARIGPSDVVMVIGCGAVGLAAVQGARLAGAAKIIAVDIDDAKLVLAQKMGATSAVNARRDDVVAAGKTETSGRGVDTVLEAAGSATAFRSSVEAVRPGGEIVWLGKIDVAKDVAFRWGALMQDGKLMLDELITQRIRLDAINEGFSALRSGKAIRTVVEFD